MRKRLGLHPFRPGPAGCRPRRVAVLGPPRPGPSPAPAGRCFERHDTGVRH